MTNRLERLEREYEENRAAVLAASLRVTEADAALSAACVAEGDPDDPDGPAMTHALADAARHAKHAANEDLREAGERYYLSRSKVLAARNEGQD